MGTPFYGSSRTRVGDFGRFLVILAR
jgi:hypothetical protein